MRCDLRSMSKECAKGLLLLMNALCMFLGIMMLAFAVVDTRILKQYGEDEAIGTFTGNLIMIFVCILLIIVAALGCFGVVMEKAKVLYVYVGLISFLAILELMTGIFVAVQRCGLNIRVKDYLREDFFKNVTGDELIQHDKEWDYLQIDYECCGLNGPGDYVALHQQISLSCCPKAYSAHTKHAQELLYQACLQQKIYYRTGCEEQILWRIESSEDFLFSFAFVTFWFELAGVLLAMWVARNILNSVIMYKQTVKY